MTFDEFGNLVPGQHILTLEQLGNKFVEDVFFASSHSRKEIYMNFIEFIDEIIRLDMLDGLTKIWIDGSFTTKKLHPNDIDLILFYDYSSKNKKKLEHYLDLQKFKMKNSKRCHFNCLTDYSNTKDFALNKERQNLNESISKRLIRYFEYDTQDRNKGYISIDLHKNRRG